MQYSRNILFGLCLCALAVFFIWYYTPMNKTNEQPPENVRQVKAETEIVHSDLNAENPLEREDFSLMGIRLGDSLDSILARFGSPKLHKETRDGISYNYGDIEVIITAEKKVVNILTDKKTVSTRRNIHPGCTLADVTARYGEQYKKTETGGLELYDYTFRDDGGAFVLRFGVQAETSKVSYLSCRIVNN